MAEHKPAEPEAAGVDNPVEKVLDVPAIDLTTKGETKMPRDGSVGQADFEAVNKLTEGGMKRQEAFEKVAADKGGKAGTVAANFYRVSRAAGGGTSKRGRKPRAADAPAPSTQRRAAVASNGDMANVAEDLAMIIERMVNIAVEKRFRQMIG